MFVLDDDGNRTYPAGPFHPLASLFLSLLCVYVYYFHFFSVFNSFVLLSVKYIYRSCHLHLPC